jgi:ABC-2 type transport system permease protein
VSTTFAGTGRLARLILRRDRVILPIWVLVLAALPATYASGTRSIYPTDAGLRTYVDSVTTNPSMRALLGPVFGPNIGAVGAWRALFAMVIVGLASALMVIRHTRTEEEAGRRELLGATVVGRYAPLAAALLVTGAADLVLGALLAVWMSAIGTPAAGALALGLSWTLTGWVFAAVGGVAAQLSEGAGAARGMAIAALGAAYLLRAAGDVGGAGSGLSWLSWVSPVGWLQQVRPYAGDRWWALLPAAAVVGVLSASAFALSARRDVGAGVLAPRLGPATAAPALRSPFALAWRLHRGLLLGWGIGFAIIGLAVGGLAKSVRTMVEGSAQLGDILHRLGGAASVSDAFIAGFLNLVGLAAAGYAVQATLRLRAEEAGQRAEPVLATAVGRLRWAGSHLVFALAGPAVVLAVLGLGAGLTYGLTVHDVGGQLPRVLAGALVQLPAVWLLSGVALALFGALPDATWGAWAALAICALLGLVGAVVQLNQRILDVSPFAHVPRVPGSSVSATPLLWLTAVALLLLVGGLAGLRRRDVG